jgi:hypothetical protein
MVNGKVEYYPDAIPWSGLIKAIVPHPTLAQTLYVGSLWGGVWKTSNANLATPDQWTWQPITDGLPVFGNGTGLAVGDLAMDPADSQTLYLGVGNMIDGLGWGKVGAGIFVTRNGGGSWSLLSVLTPARAVQAILPLPGNRLLVGTDNGLWYSADGGQSFTAVTLGLAGQIKIWSLGEVGPPSGQQRILLAAQELDANGQGARGHIFWTSAAAPTAWTEASLDLSPLGPGAFLRRITVAGTPASLTVAYAIGQSTPSEMATGFLKSLDGGQSWTFTTVQPAAGLFHGGTGQPDYNQMLSVDPDNSDHVFAGAIMPCRSLNGGSTWEPLTGFNFAHYNLHPDQHCAAWSKTGPKALFIGNDGGFHLFPSPLGPIPATMTNAWLDTGPNFGLGTTMAYGLACTGAATPVGAKDQVLLGLQDNSVVKRVTKSGPLSDSDWFELVGGGDGIGGVYHPLDGNKGIATAYGSQYFRSTTNFTDFPAAWTTPWNMDQTWFTRVVPDLGDPTGNRVLTWGVKQLHDSLDFGATWPTVPITAPGYPTGPWAIRYAHVAKSNPSRMVVLADVVFVSSDRGATWTAKPLPTLVDIGGYLAPSHLWIDTFDPNTFYLTSSAYSAGTSHLWVSRDAADTWQPLDGGPGGSNGLPFGIQAHMIQNDLTAPGRLFVATDVGMYASGDAGTHWTRLGTGLPLISVQEFWQAPDGSLIRAATFGRGVWELPSPGSGLGTARLLTLTPNPAVVLAGQQLQFSATDAGLPATVAWSVIQANGGSVDRLSGRYTAPAQAGTYTVRAALAADPGVNGAVQVMVQAPVVAVEASPASSALAPGRSRQFQATVTGGAAQAVTWSVEEALGGSITSSGLYTAPSSPGAYHVRATSVEDSTKYARVTIKVGLDLNPDGTLDGLDLGILADALGTGDLNFDLDGDGAVTDADLLLLLAALKG